MTFRSFTLNLSIILCEYFLKACATMTLISQLKSTFTSDCKAMSYVPACWLPYFIFEHLTRRIKRPSPRAQPAVCQIFKHPGTQKDLSDLPHIKMSDDPLFFPLVSGSPTSFHTGLPDSAKRSVGWSSSLPPPASGIPPAQQLGPVYVRQDGSHFRQNRGGESFKSVFP